MVRNKLYLILALLLALAAGGSAYYFLDQTQQTYLPDNMVVTVRAVKDIEPGIQITDDMIEKAKLPANMSNKKALRKPELIVGQTAAQKIYAGEEILGDRLLASGTKSRLAYRIPDGYRAISIAVDEVSGVSGLIRTGDHVDLTCFIETGDASKSSKGALLLLQNIEVLQASELSIKETSDAGKMARTVVLAVTPYQAQAVTLADNQGKIRLLLRQTGETGNQYLPPLLVPSLMTPGFGGNGGNRI
ncbi:MAG: Flp pilus assembly protein CpaB [Methylocystaceae bacterium]